MKKSLITDALEFTFFLLLSFLVLVGVHELIELATSPIDSIFRKHYNWVEETLILGLISLMILGSLDLIVLYSTRFFFNFIPYNFRKTFKWILFSMIFLAGGVHLIFILHTYVLGGSVLPGITDGALVIIFSLIYMNQSLYLESDQSLL